jgi:hypothetical protein
VNEGETGLYLSLAAKVKRKNLERVFFEVLTDYPRIITGMMVTWTRGSTVKVNKAKDDTEGFNVD